MRKLLCILFISSFLLSCSSDNGDTDVNPNKNYKYKYVIYNDPENFNKCDIYNLIIINNDAFGKPVDTKTVNYIKYGEKSDTIRTNGCNIFFTHMYKNKNGEEQSGRVKSDIFIKENYPNVISISGYYDDIK